MPTFLSPSSGHDWWRPRVRVIGSSIEDTASVPAGAAHHEPSSFAYGFN